MRAQYHSLSQRDQNFDSLFPHKKNESYKYSSLDKFLPSDISQAQGEVIEVESSYPTLHLHNGEIIKNELSTRKIEADDLVKVEEYATALNNNLFTGGLVIDLKEPVIEIIHSFSGTNTDNFAASKLIIKASNIKATIIERFISAGDSLFISHSTDVETDEKSNVEHIQLNTLDASASFLLSSHHVSTGSYKNIIIHKGSLFTRNNLNAKVDKENAHVELHGLYDLKASQHVDTKSFIHHNAAHSTSEQLYKSILDDSSRGVFTGMVKVESHAQLINAAQLNKNLILSPKAHANSRPQLEIFADDVKCSHGSTTGQISEDELFYFESRGIRKDKAYHMLSKAYGNEVIMKISSPELIKYIQGLL